MIKKRNFLSIAINCRTNDPLDPRDDVEIDKKIFELKIYRYNFQPIKKCSIKHREKKNEHYNGKIQEQKIERGCKWIGNQQNTGDHQIYNSKTKKKQKYTDQPTYQNSGKFSKTNLHIANKHLKNHVICAS